MGTGKLKTSDHLVLEPIDGEIEVALLTAGKHEGLFVYGKKRIKKKKEKTKFDRRKKKGVG